MTITPKEHDEAKVFAEYLTIQLKLGKVIEFTKTAQETFTRSWSQKNKNKAEGVRSGIPDFVILTPAYLIFVEMKRRKKSLSRVSEGQKVWVNGIENLCGVCRARICYGADEAIEFVDELL